MSNLRDITPQRLRRLRRLTPHRRLLDAIVERSRESLGFFTKHPTRALEYPWILQVLREARVSSVVDIGAGVSVLPLMLADAGITVTTVDYSRNIRSLAQKDAWTEWGFLDYAQLDPRIKSFNQDFSQAPIEGTVDACYSASVIEHMPRELRLRMLSRASELIRVGGLFVLTLDLEPGSTRMWNRDRGKRVEDPSVHGTLDSFLAECGRRQFQLESLEIRRRIPHAIVDMAFCVFRRTSSSDGPPESVPLEAQGEAEAAFEVIARNRKWKGGGSETVSGSGSTVEYTKMLRPELQEFLENRRVSVLLDAPCGDFNWLRHMELPGVRYVGMDIVRDLVRQNQRQYGSRDRLFVAGDITRDPLPNADLMLCRDCLFHLPFHSCVQFFGNFLDSDIPALLLTSHVNDVNRDLDRYGAFRPINFEKPPFGFPAPDVRIPDWVAGFRERYLCLWTAEQIRDALQRVAAPDTAAI